jgi:antitoxin component YwqK of YwqJK toxin-antitoxin module
MQIRSLLTGVLILLASLSGLSQITEDSLGREENPTLDLLSDLDKKKAPKEKKELKQPKNVFFGIKSRKGFTKSAAADRVTMELFYYLPDYKDPNPYVPHVAWYNMRKKELQLTGQIDKETHRLLHGPYQRLVNGKLVEEGYYYMGTKHGRWETYDVNFMLLEKLRFHMGWPKDSQITYYDVNRTKVKEVIPVHYGIKHGDYYQFYEGGQLAVKGQYDNGKPVGKWMEYYQFRRRYKKEIQYPMDPFDKTTEPFTLREWDDKGTLTFDKEKEDKKASLSKF